MQRIKFRKGMQKKFLNKVLVNSGCPSLRELTKRIDVSYSALKNYYIERRFLPQNLFLDLCFLGKINPEKLKIQSLEKNWGQVKGGKIGKRE